MSEHQVEVTSASDQVPLLMAVPTERDADAIAAELWRLGRDVGLIDAVRAAHARFTREVRFVRFAERYRLVRMSGFSRTWARSA